MVRVNPGRTCVHVPAAGPPGTGDIVCGQSIRTRGAMHNHLEVPQGIRTLGDARPGACVVVHSVLGRYPLMDRQAYPDAGEDLFCTHVHGDRIGFERADGSRFSILRSEARRIRVERFGENDEEAWCAR